MPIGQVVGQFSSTSKIPLDGFSLTQGKGDIHNSLFTIDANGTLQSAAIFDYEASVPEFSIRVQATRGNESHIERIFSIQLVNQIEDIDADGVEDHEDLDADGDGFSNDEEVAYGSDPYNAKSIIDQPKEAEKESFRPIVRTLSDFTLIDGNLTVNAKIIDLGITTEKVIRGFIISSRPNAKLGGKNQQISKSKGNLGSFSDSFMVNQLTVKKVYIRAYARNSEGRFIRYKYTRQVEETPSPPSPGQTLPADPMPTTGGKAHGLVRSMLLRRMDGFFIRIYTGYLSSHNHRVRESGYGRKELAGFGPENQLSRIYFLMPLNHGYSYMDRRRMVPFF